MAFQYFMTHKGTTLERDVQADVYRFKTDHMSIDADGAPNCYHPNDVSGLDKLSYSGYPDDWSGVLVPDPADRTKPYTQKRGTYKGFFVSQTALCDPAKDETDPARYVDARHIPYWVFPPEFPPIKGTGRLGDVGVAKNMTTGVTSSFIIADVGPPNHPLAEVSIALAQALGGNHVNPRNGAGKPAGEMAYAVFRNASAQTGGWPLTTAQIDTIAVKHTARCGGVGQLFAGL
ncbi:hypothetical protein FF124_13085 [Martelella lutilitoris]|uniref:Uncharacterized protein n=1 Tax=Martelella lutilitoris TaxID=2583532 RepID=A0A5C4JPH7_9HYPH|nr:glycoside hydrolase family 75 protein [Martelella lutilitoris]TNB47111.1 hypothetical protein FF124_13085 [Martelella lutilitoris]